MKSLFDRIMELFVGDTNSHLLMTDPFDKATIHMVHEWAVSRDASMSESRLNRILNGWIDPHDHELKNIAHALGMGRDQLPHRGS